MSALISFDIGYASIGWCVLDSPQDKTKDPGFTAPGAVIFPADDCLASARRGLRRTRRHIRSTRMRIERMKRWLLHRGVLSRKNLDKPGHPAPFLLAAAALQGHRALDAWELWTVLRWYAHNRGYDGNSRWSRDEENAEDTEKESNARALMAKHGAVTMAETVCACLKLDPAKSKKTISSQLPYKTLNAAFPRKVVVDEVRRILAAHRDKLPGLDSETVRLLLKDEILTEDERKELAAASIRLPKRYHGGLLFGQLVPRFDNSIISRCPITWAKTFDEAIADGKSDEQARKLADKFAKVPAAKCPEFLEYRFARILANIRANGKPLDPETRQHLFDTAKERGRFTATELKKEVETRLGTGNTNLEAYFNLHPDSAKALVLDPAAVLPHANRTIKPLWPHLGEKAQTRALEIWRRGKGLCPAQLLEFAQDGGDPVAAEADLRDHYEKLPKKDAKNTTWDGFLIKSVKADYDSGRAPYARPVLKQVVKEVLGGCDPTKPVKSKAKPEGEEKAADGILYATSDPASRVRELMAERPVDSLTNNHLVRHRLLILGRLLDDIMAEFKLDAKDGDIRVIVEVARELKEFSGMTAKQITAELNSRLKDFKAAVAHLEEHAPHLLADSSQRGGIIRKCRIAMDMGWRCPFTDGGPYDATDLPKLEREHIIPYATRNTNALHALVLTWPEVNRMKGKRTAKQFIEESAQLPSRKVPGRENLTLLTPKQYDAFVDALDIRGHDDDRRRKKARKALLNTVDFEDKELGFTEGQLTQSSHLMKLAMGEIKRQLPGASVDPVPGPVTAEIRKSWSLTGTLAMACPEVLDANGEVRPKDEIRGITHLHHALDAAILALAAHYIPFQARGLDQKGKIWQALLKRNQTDDEKKFLLGLGCCQAFKRDGKTGERTVVGLKDLPPRVKNALARSLAESRVMQHVPSDRSGTKAELTTWGVVEIAGEGDDARVKLHQRSIKVENGTRKITMKTGEERAGKLLGVNPKGGKGKLKAIKGAMVIGENYGIALDPTPVVIPFHDVTQRLDDICAANDGNRPKILRNGNLFRVATGAYQGIWLLRSIADGAKGIKVRISRPHYIPDKTPGVKWAKDNVNFLTLLKAGIEMLPQQYCAYKQ